MKNIVLLLIVVSVGLIATGCSQSVDAVKLNPRNTTPTNASKIFNADLQGAAETSPASTNFLLGISSFGGTAERTSSASASYVLTGGIGVD